LPKLPVVSAREAIAALQRAGFVVEREAGHTVLVHEARRRVAVVPRHGGRDLTPGTVRGILNQAGLTPEEFRELLR